jgi:hypothetical protein
MANRNPYDIDKGDMRRQETEGIAHTATSGPNENLSPEEFDEVRLFGMKIGLAAKRGNAPAARAMLEEAIAAMRPQVSSPLLTLTLAEVGIELRACNYLEEREPSIVTVEQLLQARPQELLAIPGFGELTLVGIFAQLVRFMLNRMFEVEQLLAGNG